MVEFGTFSALREWVRVRVLGHGFGVRGRKVKSRDCALASDLVRATLCSLLKLSNTFTQHQSRQLASSRKNLKPMTVNVRSPICKPQALSFLQSITNNNLSLEHEVSAHVVVESTLLMLCAHEVNWNRARDSSSQLYFMPVG